MINFLVGDATRPVGSGRKYLVHICNDLGRWGSGFVLAVSARWNTPKEKYLEWKSLDTFRLGEIQTVKVEDDLVLINMIAQHGVIGKNNPKPVDYDAVEKCLNQVFEKARKNNATVHMPRIGAGLGGGDWTIIQKIIEKTAGDVEVFVYDLGK